jgi:type VI secretion system secreted protein Hcp
MPIYMRITKNGVPVITGDVTAPGHEQWIELSSFSFGHNRPKRAPAPNEKPPAQDITVTKTTDSASTKLMHGSLGLAPFDEGLQVQFDFVKGANITYYKVYISDALISGWSISGGGDKPSETVTFNFTKLGYDFDVSPRDDGWQYLPAPQPPSRPR